MTYQPKTGEPCHCKRGVQRDNCPDCEGTGMRIDFAKIRAATVRCPDHRNGGATRCPRGGAALQIWQRNQWRD